MDRGDFLRAMALSPLGALALGWEPIPEASPEPPVSDLPNILIIITDDQPYYAVDEMPKAQSIFGAGMGFTNAYVACPTCSPSRTAMMTGRYPSNNGLRINDHAAKRFREKGLHRESLGYHLSQSGYACALFGKLLNGYEEIPAFRAPGFSKWMCSLTEPNPVKVNVDGRLRKTAIAKRDEAAWLSTRTAEWITLQADSDNPFFAVLSLHNPHVPANASLAHRDEYDSAQRTLPPNFDHFDANKPESVKRDALTNAEKTEYLQMWRGVMEELQDVDDAVETVTSAVDFDTTYVFYMTDNGFLLGEHRLVRKAQPYEEAIRTPLYVRGPAVVENATSDALASLVDIAPTIYELAGLDELASACDGRSLLGHMIGAEDVEWRDSLLVEMPEDAVGGQHTTYPGWHALRTNEWFLCDRQSGFKELYDMAEDPYQLSNVASNGETDVLVHEMSIRLDRIRSASGEDLRTQENAPLA